MNVIAIRLKPGDDLKQSLLRYCRKQQIEAAFILSGIGSLSKASIRFANQEKATVIESKLEIITLDGTLSQYGAHLHISVSNSEGAVIGGHLMEGTQIFTTGEILLGLVPNIRFMRQLDLETGYHELQVEAYD